MKRLWTEELFGTSKPIVAMCHLDAMPGDPGFDRTAGMEQVVANARADLLALQNGGVDAVLFSNEFSLPYKTKVDTVTVASMARVIGELKADIRIPFGVNVLWDAIASLDLAAAVGAGFVREIFTGVYASDFGLWNTDCGETVRHRDHIHASDVRMLFNIVPESAVYLAEREVVSIAKSTVFNARPDALCVSGLTAGTVTDEATLKAVKDTVPDTVVFANTGVKLQNLEKQLAVADGAVVGTWFKRDAVFENHVDEARVKEFMDRVRRFRS